ncbi:MAG: hypothetical protein ACREH8_03525 [Opitutaceae bacterium]
MPFSEPGGAITGKGGGALGGPGIAAETGGGGGGKVDEVITGGTPFPGIFAASLEGAGGTTADGIFGFSLNLPLSTAGAGKAGIGAGVSEDVGDAARSIISGAGGSETNNGGTFTGAGGVTKSGGDGAIMCGFAIADGGTTDGIWSAGLTSGSLAAAGDDSGAAGLEAAVSRRGLNRILGIAGTSPDGSAEAAGVSSFTDGTGANAGSSPSGGTPAGAGASADRSLGFSRRAAVGGACSSLMRGLNPIIRTRAKGKKFPSPSKGGLVTFRPDFNMIKAFSFCLSVTILCCSSGCLFSKKNKRPKENAAISADVEESFRRRWVEKRSAELVAQGTAVDDARTRAESEFRERYGFTRAGQK